MTLRAALTACVLENTERSKAFIYRKYYGYVMAIVIRYMQHEMEAEEIVNESFVKVFKKLDAFSMHDDDDVLDKTFRSWMARIAVNTSIDSLRSRKKSYMLDDVSEQDMLVHAVAIKDSLGTGDILALLNHLPEIQRSIFNLFEIEGYSHDEIGKLIGIPESTSRTYLTRAKQRLRKLYALHFDISQDIHS